MSLEIDVNDLLEEGNHVEVFADRRAAGRELAEQLLTYADREGVIVLGLPRGGVPVAAEVADRLHSPLDVFVVRKLGMPGHEELAVGAIASGGVLVVNDEVIAATQLDQADLRQIAEREQQELTRREIRYRGGRPSLELAGRTVILIDDGLATGATMRAAIRAVRQSASAVVVGVPVASPRTCAALGECVDQIVCARTPEPFGAVGLWYRRFDETSDEEVCELLEHAAAA